MTGQACFVKINITEPLCGDGLHGLFSCALSLVTMSNCKSAKAKANTCFPTPLPLPSNFLQ